MVRTYKPKKPRARRGRMLRAARMRTEGMSLREIASEIGVSKDTIMRDLRAWDVLQANVSHLPVSKPPRGGGNETPARDGNETPDAAIVPLRRSS
jgi:hypothetical protein